MPLPFIHSTDSLFGLAYTGVRGLLLSGAWNPSTSITGPRPMPAGIALVQPGDACSTAGPTSQLLSTATGTGANANFVYVSQSSGAISTSSYAAAQNAPPQTGMGAAIHWNGGAAKLAIYSTASGSGTWFYSAAFTSSQ